jgi:hypothetical protein
MRLGRTGRCGPIGVLGVNMNSGSRRGRRLSGCAAIFGGFRQWPLPAVLQLEHHLSANQNPSQNGHGRRAEACKRGQRRCVGRSYVGNVVVRQSLGLRKLTLIPAVIIR